MTTYSANKNITKLNLATLNRKITVVDCKDCCRLTEIENKPSRYSRMISCFLGNKKIKELNLSRCQELPELSNLPESLTKLKIYRCPKLKKLDLFNCQELTELDLPDCEKLIELSNLPESLTKLTINFYQGLKKLDLSNRQELIELNLYGCKELIELVLCGCKGLKELVLCGCEKLPESSNLPESLTKLKINCYRKLDLFNCQELTELDLFGDKELIELSNLPESLTKLTLHCCPKLEKLDLSNCQGLTKLELFDCNSLPNSPEFIQQLLELEEKNNNNPNFQLIWPVHINRDPKILEVKQHLSKAYQEYYKSDNIFKNKALNLNDHPTFALFNRFMTESLGQRGGVREIVDPALEVAKKIADNSESNPWIVGCTDQSSRSYLAACVNQPVAGFTEIATMADIVSQTDIQSKLEKAKILKVTGVIREMVLGLKNGDDNKVGAEVEVELGNAILKKVHDKLSSKGAITEDKKWLGVPKGVAYQDTISSFLTEENVKKISQKVEEVLLLTNEQVLDFLCQNNYQDFWAQTVLDEKKYKELNRPLENHKVGLNGEVPNDAYVTELNRLEIECREEVIKESRKKTNELLLLNKPLPTPKELISRPANNVPQKTASL